MMPTGVFQHVRLSMVNDVVLVEILSTEVQGPDRALEFSSELNRVAGEESAKPLLVDLRRARKSRRAAVAFDRRYGLVDGSKGRITNLRQVVEAMAKYCPAGY